MPRRGKQATIRTPPSALARRLWVRIQARTRRLTCQLALSQISSNAFFPCFDRQSQAHPRKSSVTWLTGRPCTKRSSICPVSPRSSP